MYYDYYVSLSKHTIVFAVHIAMYCMFSSSEEGGYFEGVLLCKDDEVTAFVVDI